MCKYCGNAKEHGTVPITSLTEIKSHPKGKPYLFLVDNGKLSPNGTWEMEQFFQTYPDDVVYGIKPGEADMLDILLLCGLFPSKGQARKAGWPVEIPAGFSDWKIGKYKTEVTVFNPMYDYATMVD